MGKYIQVEGEAMPQIISSMDLNIERNECSTTKHGIDIHKDDEETKKNGVYEASISSVKKDMNPHDILSHLLNPMLQNICKLLAQEGLSNKVYSLAVEILKNLANMTSLHNKLLISELAKLVGDLSDAIMCELATLENTEMLGLSSHSMAREAILRVLRALTALISSISDGIDSHKTQRYDKEEEGNHI